MQRQWKQNRVHRIPADRTAYVVHKVQWLTVRADRPCTTSLPVADLSATAQRTVLTRWRVALASAATLALAHVVLTLFAEQLCILQFAHVLLVTSVIRLFVVYQVCEFKYRFSYCSVS